MVAFFVFCFWHTEFRFKFFGKIHLLYNINIKVVGFVLKKILYFEMLIVPHALHCVDSCIFVFTSFDTGWHTVLVSMPPFPPLSPPPPPPSPPTPFPKIVFIRFSFFVKIHLLLTRELTVKVVGLPPPPPFPQFFL